jgi:hypothetical protein
MTPQLSVRFDAFAAALDEAREIAEVGGFIDLSGLDAAAAEICGAASALPAGERWAAAQRLVAIAAGLDALAAALAAHPPLREGRGSRAARAANAYRGGKRTPTGNG